MTSWLAILVSRLADISVISSPLAHHFTAWRRAVLATLPAVNILLPPRKPRCARADRRGAARIGAAALLVLAALPPCTARADDLTPSVLGQAGQMALQAATQAAGLALPGAARIEVTPGTLDPRLRLQPCERIEPYLPVGVRLWGRTRVGLRCLQGLTLWNVWLPVTVKVFAPGVVVTTSLPAGSVLGLQHLAVAEIDWAADSAAAFVDPARLVGRTLARPLAGGGALRIGDVKARQWFAAGDTVRLIATGPGFSVSGEAQALSPGLEGQTARVRTEGGRIVTGLPVGERRIEVAL